MSHPHLLEIIHKAVKAHLSYLKAVNALKNMESMEGVFNTLNESTVRGWYVPHTFELSDDTLKRWKEGAAQARSGGGRPSMMSKHPEVERYVIDAITSVREAGGTINSVIISSLFRGYIKVKLPNLLREYKLSRRWCRWWFAQQVSTAKLQLTKCTTSTHFIPRSRICLLCCV